MNEGFSYILQMVYNWKWLPPSLSPPLQRSYGSSTEESWKNCVIHCFCVYAPSFLKVHFRRRAPDGPAKYLYMRNLALSHKAIDKKIYQANKKCLIKHAESWLTPHNEVFSVFSNDCHFSVENLKSDEQELPETAHLRALLLQRMPLKCYFTRESKTAPCLMNGTKEFWCSIDNNNQANERFVGKVKMVLKQGMVEDF